MKAQINMRLKIIYETVGSSIQLTGCLFLSLLVISCIPQKKSENMENSQSKEAIIEELEPKVTGVGGIFFFSEDPESIKEWYGKNLGLAVDQYGSPFEFRNANRPDEINYLQWSPFSNQSTYFEPSKKEFMINYRVQNIEGLIKKLKENGVTVLDSIETYDYGKFVHIMDIEGNKIELWEPIDSVLTKLGSKTTK